MSEAAVLEPVADTQVANPTPDTQAPPNSEGTDGEQSQVTETTTQTAPSETSTEEAKPDAVVAPPAPQRSEEEIERDLLRKIEADAKEAQRQDDLKRTQGELRDLRRDGPRQVRGLISKLEKGEVDFVDARDQIENWAENLNLKALEAARLEVSDDGTQALQEEQQAFIASCYASIDPANRAAFTAEVNGKNHEAWVKAAQKYAPTPAGLVSVSSFAAEAPKVAAEAKFDLDDSEKTALETALKSARTPAAIIAAAIEVGRKRGQRDPGPSVEGKERVSPPVTTFTDLTKLTGDALKNMPDDVFEKAFTGGKS